MKTSIKELKSKSFVKNQMITPSQTKQIKGGSTDIIIGDDDVL